MKTQTWITPFQELFIAISDFVILFMYIYRYGL